MKRLNRFTAFFAASVSIALATAPAGYALEKMLKQRPITQRADQ